MRAPLIRLGALLVLLAVVSQLLLPSYLGHRIESRLTSHGGSANVDLSAFPAVRLPFGEGDSLHVRAHGLSLDLPRAAREDVFGRLNGFGDVTVAIADSRAGPFTVRSFWMKRRPDQRFDLILSADATAGDVARYAGAQLGGGFGQALAGLAAGAFSAFDRPIPVDARMVIDATTSPPTAVAVQGAVAGLPAGPLAQVVANTLLGSL